MATISVGQTVEVLLENLKGRTTLTEESGSVLQIPNSLFFQKMFRVSSDLPAVTANPREHGDNANKKLD